MAGGPLKGVKIIELAGLGAGPMAVMMLADMGADVIRIDRIQSTSMDRWDRKYDVCGRTRRSIAIDLRKPSGAELALSLIDGADGLIESFRPGVAERLGFGPDVCLQRNPRLVYGRMTGWGQEGPLAARAGHDLSYIALTGALASIGRQGQPPTPPLNLVGDGCGAMLMAFGMVCALHETLRSGQGQVVDAAMMDAASLVYAPFFTLALAGKVKLERGVNAGDGGAPYYDAYETADGQYVSVAAMEPQFYARLIELMGLSASDLPEQNDRTRWPEMKRLFADQFKLRTRDEWIALLQDEDTCFAPVLLADEAPAHPHAVARQAYCEVSGVLQPSPAPRFARSGVAAPTTPPERGQDTDAILLELGISEQEIARLRAEGIIG